MARDNQAFTVGDGSTNNFTVADHILLKGGGVGVLPTSRIVFRGSATLDGSGVGDTADCRITLPLPSDTVWQLDQFAFHVQGTDGYDENLLEMFIAPSTTAFGASTQVNFPILKSGSANPSQVSLAGTAQYALCGQAVSAPGFGLEAVMPFNDPFRIISFNDVSAGADPVIWLSGGSTTNVTGGTIRMCVGFLGYTFEQMDSAILWAGLNERG